MNNLKYLATFFVGHQPGSKLRMNCNPPIPWSHTLSLLMPVIVTCQIVAQAEAQGIGAEPYPPPSRAALPPHYLPAHAAIPSISATPHQPAANFTIATSGGSWIALTNQAPDNISLMLLLPNGTVMAKGTSGGGDGYGNAWYKLTPDSNGSYVNGTWTTLAPMHDTRLYFSSQVLRNDCVFVAGGEYGSGASTAEIYNPFTDSWTQINPPVSLLDPTQVPAGYSSGSQAVKDACSESLPDGRVLIVPVAQQTWGGSLIYDPAINIWSAGPTLANGIYSQAEAAWVKLPDRSILTIDPGDTSSERYIPSTNTWASEGTLPVDIYNNGEMGTGILLPNGKAFFLGGTGHTVLYTPSGTTSPGSWTAGPDIPNSQGTSDAPATMMPNGKVLCIVSPLPTIGNNYTSPTSFYEYDYTTNAFAQVNGPFGPTDNRPTYPTFMLDLPDGTVLYSRYGGQLYVYRPTGVVLAAGKPTISSVTKNSDGSYHLTGTLLNGISEGASYGDDAQMGTNYPIVRLSNSNGQVYYTWTYNWSSTGVMTGSTLQTTEFTLPANLPSGTYSLAVVANGIASDPISFDTRAQMASPVPGWTFNSSTVTFSWTRGSANGYALWVGSSPGSSDIYHGGQSLNTVGTVSNIPTDGRNIYVRLWSFVGNSWLYIDYTYRALAGPPRSTPKADFNGDGKSDIVWQDNSAGERVIWFMSGTTYAGGVDLGRIPVDWKIASTGDFNGNGKTDIVWQNASTGTCSIWFMNGTSHVGTVDIAYVPIEWQIAAAGDFNGDGQTDILWQNTSTGERTIWFMNGASYSSGVSLGVVPTQWRIVGAGDFSADGQTDILWQNTSTGVWAIWFMNGSSYSSGIGFGPIPLQWQIAGTGDFNSDGNPDILWQNISTGERAIWLMHGSTHFSSASLGTAPVQWEMRNH